MKAWYSTPIQKIRIVLPNDDSGGDTLTVERAAVLRDRLDEAIDEAKRDRRLMMDETPEETADRHMAEAEAAHEAKLDRKRERWMDGPR